MRQFSSRLRSLASMALAFALAAPLAAQSFSPIGPVGFGNVAVGNSANFTLTFNAPAATTISSVAATTDGVASRDFTVAQQNCVGTVTTCTIKLAFAPFYAGQRRGYVALLGATGNVIASTYLSGTGINAQISYSPVPALTASLVTSLSPANFSPTSSVPDGIASTYYNDIANNRLLKFSSTGAYSSIASLTGSTRSTLAIGGDGTIYASSPTQAVVYAIPPGGTATTISTGGTALVTPTGLATDGIGNLYIADAGTNHIVRTALDGSGSAVVTLTGITLSSPGGLAIDAANNLYIVDSGNDRVIELNLTSNAVSVVTITSLTLNNPAGISVDPAGALYIADTGNQRIVVVPPGAAAYALPLTGVTLASPAGISVMPDASLMITDPSVGLAFLPRASLAVTYPTSTTVGAADTTDGFKTFTVQNTGNLALRLVPQTTTANPAISTADFTDAGGTFTCPTIAAGSPTSPQIAVGASCTYAVEFRPAHAGTDNATFTMYLADAGTSGISINPFVVLTGNGITSLNKFTITATPSTVLVGAPESFTVTALNSSGTTAADYLGTATFTSTDTSAVFLGGTTYTFTAADAGTHTFSGASAANFHQVGSFTLSVTDGSVTAASNAVQVQAQSAIAINATPNPVAIGGTVTVTATLSSASAGITRTPTGTVTFSNIASPGATPVSLGTVTLNASGVATITTSFTTAGMPCITAAYAGDTSFIPVNSGSYCELVSDFTVTLNSASSANATVVYGKPVSYIFDIKPVGSSTFFVPVTFSVAGLGAAAPFTITPTTVNTGAGPSTVTLTITPTAHQSHQTLALNRVAPLTLALVALPFVFWRRRKFRSALAVLALTALLVFPTGCATGNSGYFNPAFSLYKIVLTGASGSVTHSATVTLTVE